MFCKVKNVSNIWNLRLNVSESKRRQLKFLKKSRVSVEKSQRDVTPYNYEKEIADLYEFQLKSSVIWCYVRFFAEIYICSTCQ